MLGDHPGGDAVEADDVGGQRHGQGDETTEPGDETAGGGELEVGATICVDGRLGADRRGRGRLRRLRGRVERADAVDAGVDQPRHQGWSRCARGASPRRVRPRRAPGPCRPCRSASVVRGSRAPPAGAWRRAVPAIMPGSAPSHPRRPAGAATATSAPRDRVTRMDDATTTPPEGATAPLARGARLARVRRRRAGPGPGRARRHRHRPAGRARGASGRAPASPTCPAPCHGPLAARPARRPGLARRRRRRERAAVGAARSTTWPRSGARPGLDDLTPLLRAAGVMHVVLHLQGERLVYAHNGRNRVDFDVHVRHLGTGDDVAVWTGGGMVSAGRLSPTARRLALALTSLLPMSTHLRARRRCRPPARSRSAVRPLTDPDEPGRHERLVVDAGLPGPAVRHRPRLRHHPARPPRPAHRPVHPRRGARRVGRLRLVVARRLAAARRDPGRRRVAPRAARPRHRTRRARGRPARGRDARRRRRGVHAPRAGVVAGLVVGRAVVRRAGRAR